MVRWPHVPLNDSAAFAFWLIGSLQIMQLADGAKIKTAAGCNCLPHSHEEGQLIGSGCLPDEDGASGWCDVEPGCAGAQEQTADYAGFDACQLDSAAAEVKAPGAGPFGVSLPSIGPWGMRFGLHPEIADVIGVAAVGGASAETGLIKEGDVMVSLGGSQFRPGLSNEEAMQHINKQKQLAAAAGSKVVELLLRRPDSTGADDKALPWPRSLDAHVLSSFSNIDAHSYALLTQVPVEGSKEIPSKERKKSARKRRQVTGRKEAKESQGMSWDSWSVLPGGEKAQCPTVRILALCFSQS